MRWKACWCGVYFGLGGDSSMGKWKEMWKMPQVLWWWSRHISDTVMMSLRICKMYCTWLNSHDQFAPIFPQKVLKKSNNNNNKKAETRGHFDHEHCQTISDRIIQNKFLQSFALPPSFWRDVSRLCNKAKNVMSGKWICGGIKWNDWSRTNLFKTTKIALSRVNQVQDESKNMTS